MIVTEGISGPGKTEFRLKLRAIKHEADSDLLFKTTEETIRQIRSRRQDIDMYSRKNGQSVELKPMLPDANRRLPAGKQAFISSQPRQEALSDDKWF